MNLDIAGAPKSRLHSAYTVLSGRHTDDDDFALNVRFVCSIVCVMYKSLGGRLRSMDVSGFEGKSKILCDDSIMMFNVEYNTKD